MPPKGRACGYIEELPSGSFRAVVYAGTDPLTGRPRYLRETAKSYAGAEVALTRLQRQVDEDAHPKSALTIGEAVDQWLDVAKLEDTTRDRYEHLVRLYIGPTFGDLAAPARRRDPGEVLRPAPTLPATTVRRPRRGVPRARPGAARRP